MANVLLITSDQHNPFFCGYAGDRLVTTPNLDRLAVRGATFTAAYTNNPICMPARASLATGRYGSTIGSYDNGSPYDGGVTPSFGHRLREADRVAVTFGKLHFDPEADSGFRTHLPLQAKRGYGAAIQSWARGSARPNRIMVDHALDAAPGPSEYERYDRHTTASACRWLTEEAPRDRPWLAHVSYAHPHYPFRAPAARLPADDVEIPLPPAWRSSDWPRNPELDARRRLTGYDEHALDEDELRRLRWVYAGMVNAVDAQIGLVLSALGESGLADETVVVYTSDHGDMLGSHGFLMKGLLYDASARVPLVMAGPGVDGDTTCETAVSLVDVFPTVLDVTGCRQTDEDRDLPGTSLLSVAGGADDPDRAVFSEYHGPSSTAASFMIRRGRWKFVRHLADGTPPQLFDLAADPDELDDRADEPAIEPLLAELDDELCAVVDPVETDRRIRAEQAALLAAADRPRPPGGGQPQRTPLGTIAAGWSVPPDEFMRAVNDAATPESP
ncbi:MAG: sulfatase-like hydrolase/transferase [Actinomycetota bacterium]